MVLEDMEHSMATRGEWNRLIDAHWDLALVEDRVRYEQAHARDDEARNVFTHILYANFGVYP
jgi:hypothetical protein